MAISKVVHSYEIYPNNSDNSDNLVARVKVRVYDTGMVILDVFSKEAMVISQLKMNGGAVPTQIVLEPKARIAEQVQRRARLFESTTPSDETETRSLGWP